MRKIEKTAKMEFFDTPISSILGPPDIGRLTSVGSLRRHMKAKVPPTHTSVKHLTGPTLLGAVVT